VGVLPREGGVVSSSYVGTLSSEGGVVSSSYVGTLSGEGGVVSSSCAREEQGSIVVAREARSIVEGSIATYYCRGVGEYCCVQGYCYEQSEAK
jgi:hypothetical protein